MITTDIELANRTVTQGYMALNASDGRVADDAKGMCDARSRLWHALKRFERQVTEGVDTEGFIDMLLDIATATGDVNALQRHHVRRPRRRPWWRFW